MKKNRLYIFRSVNNFKGGNKHHEVIWCVSINCLKYNSLCTIPVPLEIKLQFLYFVEDQADLPGSAGHLTSGHFTCEVPKWDDPIG